MSIAASLSPEFDAELTTTRKLIEISPDAKAAWKPHPKSFALGDLGLHIANLVGWTTMTLQRTELDLNPPGGPPWTSPKFESVQATLQLFDDHVRAGRAALLAATDEDLQVGWTLKSAGVPLFTMPRVACLRSFVLNHVIHHRGQLSVYLRLLDVPLPRIYGPTADTAL
jgi:uncharacterized damage-inducible protein DinB